MPALRHFPKIGREQGGEANGGHCGEHQHRVHAARSPGQADGVDGPDQHGEQHPGVAEIEVEVGEYIEVATSDDGQCAAKRNDDAQPFKSPQMLAEKCPGNGDGNDRNE